MNKSPFKGNNVDASQFRLLCKLILIERDKKTLCDKLNELFSLIASSAEI